MPQKEMEMWEAHGSEITTATIICKIFDPVVADAFFWPLGSAAGTKVRDAR